MIHYTQWLFRKILKCSNIWSIGFALHQSREKELTGATGGRGRCWRSGRRWPRKVVPRAWTPWQRRTAGRRGPRRPSAGRTARARRWRAPALPRAPAAAARAKRGTDAAGSRRPRTPRQPAAGRPKRRVARDRLPRAAAAGARASSALASPSPEILGRSSFSWAGHVDWKFRSDDCYK